MIWHRLISALRARRTQSPPTIQERVAAWVAERPSTRAAVYVCVLHDDCKVISVQGNNLECAARTALEEIGKPHMAELILHQERVEREGRG